MRRIIGKKTHKSSSFLDTKQRIVGTVIVSAVIMIIITLLIIKESGDNQFVIKNNTDLKLEYMNAYFVDAEGPIEEGFKIGTIEPGKSLVNESGIFKLLSTESNFEMRFKFENYDEILVDAGYFNDTFDGNITADFQKSDDDNIILKVKAKNGLLPTNQIDCNEKFLINLSEGYVEE
ncbi:MAG: hypothetical protein ACYDEX_05875 [Mobilitalea sp.]